MSFRLFCFFLFSCACVFSKAEDDWRYRFSTVKKHLYDSITHVDLSKDTTIQMPQPSIAYVNIKGVSTMPINKSIKRLGYLEVLDGNGRYFKKHVIFKGQGNYSVRFEKKNFSAEFCEKNWSGEYLTDIKIGDWVSQEKFHFKAFYTDFMRGIGEVGYKIFDDVVADRDPYWERCGYDKESIARCYPDGFPCVVYMNDVFYGVYAWQLKKSRKNMNQKKKKSEHIHLDGDLRDNYIFRGNVDWTTFEVRNPEYLYTMYNNVYDGDAPQELMDTTSLYYSMDSDNDDVKENKKRTAEAKSNIVSMSNYYNELHDMDSLGISEADFKKEFEKRYDVDGLIDYYVYYRLCMNGDGVIKNWQWFTYNGVKWCVTPYDLDQIFGLSLYGFYVQPRRSVSNLDQGPYEWVNKYYAEEERERYFDLRDRNVFSEENIVSHIQDWHDRVGDYFYDLEREKWPDSPCYNDVECNKNWNLYENEENYYMTLEYSPTRTYFAGDICVYEGRLWICTGTSKGVIPVSRNSAVDSMERLVSWVGERIKFLDEFYGYSEHLEALGCEPSIHDNNVGRKVVGIYDMSGTRLTSARKGVNIYKYDDGSSRKVVLKAE